MKENLLRIIFVILGSFIYSIGVNMFIIPHKFLSGGVAGIAIIFQYFTGIPSGYFVILINIPIFILGFKTIDKEFGIFSFMGMVFMALLLIITKSINVFYYLQDPLLSALCSGVLTGIGAGILFKFGASFGGTDIVAVWVKKKYGIKIGKVTFLINAIIVFMGIFIGSLPRALYTLISMYMYSVVVEKVIQGFYKEKVLFVITENSDEVEKAICKKIGRGVTYLYGEGAYTGNKKKVIYSIMNPAQIEQTKKFILDMDPRSVMSIMDVSEVRGKGFKTAIF
ncbi:YitT family protein [Clostridium sp. BJN0013]|uniref:YitT family protein n=1 Tax=Clostridium sp. BJN0013 TaxID=3236840 RepID=UPI0034C62FAA